jgi:competence protein ComEA
VVRGRRAASRAGPVSPYETAQLPGERATLLLGDDQAARPQDTPGTTGAAVLPRAAAMASARAAVRRGRERRAASRGTNAVHEAGRETGGVTVTDRDGAVRATTGGEAGGAAARTSADGASMGDTTMATTPTGRGEREVDGLADDTDGRRGMSAAAGRRGGLPLWERLPLWVQLRCGIEPRTLLALAVVLVVAVGFAVHHFWTGRPEAVKAPAVERAPEGTAAGEPRGAGRPAGAGTAQLPGRRLMVDVGGKVRKPGVYKLANGARVADALRAAGGVRPGTDLSGLNRARRLIDGEQIVAGRRSPAGPATGSGAAQGAEGPRGDAGASSARAAAEAPGGAAQGAPVSLSSATVGELETLPGVGPVLAQHIVEYREEHGGFTSVSQLKEVDGIGDSRFADLEPKVSP